MATKVEYVSKTQHYLKVKKPLLERQRRARMNKCLDSLKTLVAEFQGDDAILRMDKAEMLESVIVFMRSHSATAKRLTTPASTTTTTATAIPLPMDSFRNGYMNAVNEASRVMAATPGMSVQVGKSVMTHLGLQFNRLLRSDTMVKPIDQPLRVETNSTATGVSDRTSAMSPASSGYHSDFDESPLSSPSASVQVQATLWRPW